MKMLRNRKEHAKANVAKVSDKVTRQFLLKSTNNILASLIIDIIFIIMPCNKCRVLKGASQNSCIYCSSFATYKIGGRVMMHTSRNDSSPQTVIDGVLNGVLSSYRTALHAVYCVL
jgi:hypothetical protein